jgi:hypothetical protein
MHTDAIDPTACRQYFPEWHLAFPTRCPQTIDARLVFRKVLARQWWTLGEVLKAVKAIAATSGVLWLEPRVVHQAVSTSPNDFTRQSLIRRLARYLT